MLLLVAGLVIVAALFAVVRRREIRSPRVWLLVAAAVTVGTWTFLTIGATVTVPDPRGDPRGTECVVNPFGDNPDRAVRWSGDCGQALARHLLASGGPSLLMLTISVASTTRALRQSRSRSAHTTAAPS